MDILTALKKLGDLERDLEKVYGWLAMIFKDDERASEFFRKLAHDEQLTWILSNTRSGSCGRHRENSSACR